VQWNTPAWILYDLWAKWFFGLTPLGATSLALAVTLAVLAIAGFRARPAFVGRLVTCGMFAAIWILPYQMPGFGYVNARMIPFVWLAALVRVPERIPRALAAVLGACAALYAAGNAVDLFRAEADSRAFAAGAPAVPEGARLLTLNFKPRVTSKNTWSLEHASGLYVVERGTSAQDVWADSPTMPITFREPPDFFADPVLIRRFVAKMESSAAFCDAEARAGASETEGDCVSRWRAIWAGLFEDARGRFDHVVLWGAPDEVRAIVPTGWGVAFEKGMLVVLERR
jgi:hypothetical protein